eukprot:6545644-Prymnesium_polylepis.1
MAAGAAAASTDGTAAAAADDDAAEHGATASADEGGSGAVPDGCKGTLCDCTATVSAASPPAAACASSPVAASRCRLATSGAHGFPQHAHTALLDLHAQLVQKPHPLVLPAALEDRRALHAVGRRHRIEIVAAGCDRGERRAGGGRGDALVD